MNWRKDKIVSFHAFGLKSFSRPRKTMTYPYRVMKILMTSNRTFDFKFRLLTASVLILIPITFTAGRRESDKKQYVVVAETENGAEKKLRLSELLLLDLREQPGTGYGWQLVSVDHEFWSVDTVKDEEAQSLRKTGILPDRAAQKGKFGGTEWQVFRLKPRKVGSTRIELDYARPWQSESPAKKFVLKIVVEK
jgi:predicted secreted protein